MKKTLRFLKRITPMLALAVMMMAPIWGWGQIITEGFETGLPAEYTATTSYTLGSGIWTGQAYGIISSTVGVHSGTYSCQIRSQTGAQITSPNIATGGVSTVTFWGSASTTSGAVQVNFSTDGGLNWTPATGSPFSLTTGSSVQKTATINSSSSNILVQFYRTGATVYIDDVVINAYSAPSDPNLSITGGTDHGSVCPNTTATPIQYTITNNGTIPAAGISVASNDAQFVVSALSSATIAAGGGTATYVVTFTPSSAGPKTATITVTSTTVGSSSPTSSLTGNGSAPVAQTITSASAGSITAQGATLNGNVTALGSCPTAIERGFVYSVTATDPSPRVGESGVTKAVVAGITTGAYNLAVTGLLSSTNYSFTSYVYNGTSYNYGTDRVFTTLGALVISGTTAHGSTCPGVAATPQSYTITNNGAFSVDGISAVSSGNNAADFVVSALSSTTIAAGGTATYVVTFTPATSGSKTATITVSSITSGIVSATSNLSGTGSTPATQAVTSAAATLITGTSAQLNGNLTTVGVCPATIEKGFVYSVTAANADPLVGGAGVTKSVVSGTSTGTYLLALSGLPNGTGYSFKAYVYNGTSYTYGSVLTFLTTTPPVNDLCSSAIPITIGSAPISGTLVNATYSSPFSSKNDVWYSFTPAITGEHSITVTGFTGDVDISVFSNSNSCPATTTALYSAATSNLTEVIAGSFTSGITYFLRVLAYDVTAESSTFTIGVFPPAPAAPTATAATDVVSSSFTANWGAVSGATGYRLDVYTKTAGANTTDLFISEYIEGSSENKALEIFNGTGSSIDLSGYELHQYNGGSSLVSYILPLSGTLANNSVFVVVRSTSTIFTNPDLSTTSAVMQFNGDDAIALYNISTSSNVDIFGRIGEDPGFAWTGAGGYSTLNKTLVRKSTVSGGVTTNPTSDFPTLTTEWDVYDENTVTYLGSHTFSGGTTSTPVYTDVNVGNVTNYSVTGLNPGTTYYYVVRAMNSGGTSANSNEISVTTSTTPATSTYTGTGDWSNATNWSNGLPGATTDVTITGNVTVDDVVECKDMTISPTGAVTVSADQGLSVNGNLLIESNATRTGSFIGAVADYAITGTKTLQRYLTGGWGDWNSGWHQLSSPVATQAISAFATGNYDFYGWDEPTDTWMNYKAAGFSTWNGGTNFNVGQGYMVSYEAISSTQTFTGTLNAANVPVANLSKTGGELTGWHLMGNPFASAIQWNDGTWALTNVAGNAKIWHEINKSYSDIAPNGIIPSAQGFMVQVSNAINSLTIPALARTHSTTPFYKSSQEQVLLVASETEGGSAQESKIIVNPMATEGFDFDYDSRFLAGYAPAFYSVANGQQLSTNSMAALAPDKAIPFGFVKNNASAFTIELKESVAGRVVYLTDNITGTTTNLTEQPVYSFTSAAGDQPDRFLLTFGAVGLGEPTAVAPLNAYLSHNRLFVTNTQGKAELQIFDLQGRLLQSHQLLSEGLHSEALTLTAGVYVVRLQSAQATQSVKVIVQ